MLISQNLVQPLFYIVRSATSGAEPRRSDGMYTAAVVEVNPAADGYTVDGTAKNLKQIVGIFDSSELNGVDILVLPESILNQKHTAVLLPNTKTTFCDDPNVDPILRSISCAVRKANLYAIINLYVKVKCSEDDQSFCANRNDSTNLYNMAIVLNRHGDIIAK